MSKLRAAVDGVMAHQWSHNRVAMHALQTLVDEASRIADLLDGADILESNERTDGRRQWVEIGAYLQPGDVAAVMDDWRPDQREVAQPEEHRVHTPEAAGSSPALATHQEQE